MMVSPEANDQGRQLARGKSERMTPGGTASPCPPVLLIGYNRPHMARRVFERIREAAPARLYISIDGAKAPDDEPLCEEALRLADEVTWDCKVRTNYSSRNRGCRLALIEGISWFFQNEPEGIILEEDCVPDPTFFEFCRLALERYRGTPEVGYVCGMNPHARRLERSSCWFARWATPWGWATWRDRWQAQQPDLGGPIRDWDDPSLLQWLGDAAVVRLWQHRQEACVRGWVESWDFPWSMHLIDRRQRVLVAPVNLVSNIGIGPEATHTKWGEVMETAPCPVPLVFPGSLEPDAQAQQLTVLESLFEITRGAGSAAELLGELFAVQPRLAEILAEVRELEAECTRPVRAFPWLSKTGTPAPRSPRGTLARIRSAVMDLEKVVEPLLWQNDHGTGGRLVHAMLSFSPEGEDRILKRVFKDRTSGFFVDVGAHHPFRFSNTQLLYESGWRGINIEPTPGSHELYKIWRPRDITLEVAAGAQTGQIDLHVFEEGGYNTVSSELAAEWVATGRAASYATVAVPVFLLKEIFARHLPEGETIDLLTVDTEGCDLEVLRGMDWERYRPRIVLCKNPGENNLPSASSIPLAGYLDALGYRLFAATSGTLFFEDGAASPALS